MPRYGYSCKNCGNFHDDNPISNRNTTACPKCGESCKRDVEFELNSGFDLNVGTDHERWSISMGVPPTQIAQFKKQYPGSVYDSRGRLLIKNRKHKLKEMARRGFIELDNRKD